MSPPVPLTWAKQVVHNGWGIVNVLDIVFARPLPPGLLTVEHPLVTGIEPLSGQPIWPQNLVFASPPRAASFGDEADDVIITRVGKHLAHMVSLAVPRPGQPEGPPSRMPAAVNYLHAGVHYPGVWLLFSTFREALAHFSCPRFLAEFRRLVEVERREPITVFRDKQYDRREFAEFVCALRSLLPWFSNSNGPRRRVLWGNPAPYAAVNTITGHWMKTVRLIARGRADEAARPPVRARYFQDGPYRGPRDQAVWYERLLAWATEKRIDRRGAKEGLFFVDKRRLDAGWRFLGARFLDPDTVSRRRGGTSTP
jgi:hypothetical protein